MTLKECQAKFEARLRMRPLSDNTYYNYCKRLDLLVLFFGEDRDPKTVLSCDIRAYQAYRKTEGKADSTINREYNIGIMFWNFMADELESVERHMNPFKQSGLEAEYKGRLAG